MRKTYKILIVITTLLITICIISFIIFGIIMKEKEHSSFQFEKNYQKNILQNDTKSIFHTIEDVHPGITQERELKFNDTSFKFLSKTDYKKISRKPLKVLLKI